VKGGGGMKPIPYCKRCQAPVKQEVVGFSCERCNSLLFGDAVEWKEPFCMAEGEPKTAIEAVKGG